jgi:hypothetical protein
METRIAFLCGCLEPGKDGVGDYTTLLARECERLGCATLRISLNDGYASGMKSGEGALRLGPPMSWSARIEQARIAVGAFAADVVSLQWVPYSFHPKGMPRGIDRALGRIVGGREAHILCHELWIGAEIGAKVSHRLPGAAQRAVLQSITRTLKPSCVQTSNPAYAALLARAGIEAGVLPMFGTIPLMRANAPRDPDLARFGMFGQLHPQWPPEPLLGMLRGLGKSVRIEHIGRMGEGEPVWAEMERRYAGEFSFKRHEEQPPERVSEFLTEMDFGIATTPLALIGKSATAAAMIEHGLPVIVNRNDVRYAGIEPGPAPEGVIAMDDQLPGALRQARRREAHSRLPRVAEQFLASLQSVPR